MKTFVTSIITLIIAVFIGWLFCDIDIEEGYTWYSGMWHGMFFVPNYIRWIFFDTPYKAEFYTTAYNVWYWIFSINSVGMLLSTLFEGVTSKSSKHRSVDKHEEDEAEDTVYEA